ncbi:hypothetical protein HGRIS_010439 [Hohenbuehelia grisea]|uniref:Uncharacterized protein n=1 Tax=Hohenbuehelia grisea TaxID=104357 RepID=A0ABR3IZJ4_9AGAR
MSTFTELMRLSKSQTKETQTAAQAALAEKKRREEQRRKQQAERERKERELEQKMRLKHFEEEKKEKERQQRREAEKRALEEALQRREEEQRDALRYGPKKASASKWPSSASQDKTRDAVRRGRIPGDDDDDDMPGGIALTREEKRERKLQAALTRTFHSAKRSTATGGYSRHGGRLPGGAVDITSAPSANMSSKNMSVKERLTAMPNTLMKLNTVKRDTRTIDEILQDRAKARESKVLDGDNAREFNDWFSTKKKEPPKPATASTSARATPSAPGSGSNTPQSSRKWHCHLILISCLHGSFNFRRQPIWIDRHCLESSHVFEILCGIPIEIRPKIVGCHKHEVQHVKV